LKFKKKNVIEEGKICWAEMVSFLGRLRGEEENEWGTSPQKKKGVQMTVKDDHKAESRKIKGKCRESRAKRGEFNGEVKNVGGFGRRRLERGIGRLQTKSGSEVGSGRR